MLAVLSLITALYLFHLTPHLLRNLEDNLEGLEMLDLKLKETEARLFTFMSFLCHEIRNSLFAIASTVTFMGDEQEEDNGTVDPADKKEENKKSLASIQQQTDLMIRFANDVLDLSKLESGCLALHCCDFALHEVVDNMAHIFQQQLKLKKSCIDFQFHKAPSLPAAVNGDSVRILQVVCHLLSNAVKFTESGEIVFAVSSLSTQEAVEMGCISDLVSEPPHTPQDFQPTQDDDDDEHDHRPQGGSTETAPTASKVSPLSRKDHGLSSESLDGTVHRPLLRNRETIILKLEISDTGIGMSPERLYEVWAVPYYAEEKLKHYRPQGGAGLGLALLRRLTAFMQGNLLVRSEQGRGSTFTAYLPVKVVDQNLARSNIKASSPGVHYQKDSISLQHQSPSHACSALSSLIPPVLTPMFSAPVSPGPKRMYLAEAMDPLGNIAPPTPTSLQVLEGSFFEVRTTSVPQRASEPLTTQTSSLSIKMAPRPLPLPSDELLMPAQQQRPPSQVPSSSSSLLPNQPAHLPKFDLPHNHAVVLVVEDNELNCRLLCKMLDFFHVEHVVAMNGQEAVDTIVTRSRNVLERSPEEEALSGSTDNDDGDAVHLPYFGMILMDQQMPIMDGSTAIALLRSKGLSIPIVALTANALYQTEALRAGATEFATKPILRQDLHAMCCRYLF